MVNIMKINPVEPSCSMRTGRRTDITMLIVAFGNFAPKIKLKSLKDLVSTAQ